MQEMLQEKNGGMIVSEISKEDKIPAKRRLRLPLRPRSWSAFSVFAQQIGTHYTIMLFAMRFVRVITSQDWHILLQEDAKTTFLLKSCVL